ncbi:MAG: hypothetical protein ABSF49_06630 [Roseiarcus sp.]|jgi:hypothetical protein|uniref:hypothetical protein n=1 Tax=Roseiarcus sp. TaxID=1969460 RepID=UPI003C1C001E
MKTSLSRRLLAAFALVAALAAAAPAAALDIDLTQTLAATPKTAQEIAKLCERACLGNQRRSWLESAVAHADMAGSSVTVLLKLRSKHVAHGLTIYEETATVRVDADLSLAGCGITNVRATSNNDLYRALLRAFAPRIRDAVRRHGRFC